MLSFLHEVILTVDFLLLEPFQEKWNGELFFSPRLHGKDNSTNMVSVCVGCMCVYVCVCVQVSSEK